MEYLTYNEKYWAIDIETDGLDASVIWCMGWENILTKEKGMCRDYDEIRKFFTDRPGHYFVGHNLLKFDAPVLNRLVGTQLTVGRLVDTLVLSTLYHPSIPDGHSLGAWGERIGYTKIEFNDWTHLSDEMVVYCHKDVEIGAELFRKITKVLSKIGFSEKTCYIQHQMTHILAKQQKNGFYFDAEKAIHFYQHLRRREEELQDDIRAVFPARRVHVRESRMYTKTGSPAALYQRDQGRYILDRDEVRGRYTAFEDVEFNIGSPQQRVEKLLELGWVNLPDEVTKTGNPKPFDKGDLVPSLKQFLEENPVPEVEFIAKWMSINGRANMVNNWLENWNEDDGCIHGNLFVADTLRFRHQAPNTANIPAVRLGKDINGNEHVLYGEEGYYTYEARDLWCARPGRVLVGTDAAGLELRMLAHYLNRKEFTEAVISGNSKDGTDPHSVNARLAGVSRPLAKTLLYAIQYGAQAKKVASIIKASVQEGAELRERFLQRLGIKGVMQDAIHEQETGRVWLVDGAGVVCPSPHAALNYKLQGGGARVMAQGAIFLEGHIRRSGLDSLKVGDIHDEWVYDVVPKDAEEHRRLSLLALKEAGEELNLKLPIDGNSLIGATWAHVH